MVIIWVGSTRKIHVIMLNDSLDRFVQRDKMRYPMLSTTRILLNTNLPEDLDPTINYNSTNMMLKLGYVSQAFFRMMCIDENIWIVDLHWW